MSLPLRCPVSNGSSVVALRSLIGGAGTLCALLQLASGCSSQGGQAMTDGAADLAEADMADPSHDMAAPPLLATFGGCDGPLFADGTKPQDLSTQTAFDSAWTTNWAKPQIKEGALTFGPHPLTADWWDNYSPTATVAKPGDVLICARMRLMSQQNDPAGDNSFELTMRNPDAAMYETSGMVLLIEGNASQVGLRTPMSEAERLKHKHGCALSSLIAEDETIEVPSVGGRPPRVMPRTVLSDILQPRVDEIFSLVRDELERCGLSDMLASGMVVTGGSTLLQGLPELAEEILGMPVRRGVPQGIGGLSDVVKTPIYATAVGLVLYGARKQDGLQLSQSSERRGVWRRMRSWFAEVF